MGVGPFCKLRLYLNASKLILDAFFFLFFFMGKYQVGWHRASASRFNSSIPRYTGGTSRSRFQGPRPGNSGRGRGARSGTRPKTAPRYNFKGFGSRTVTQVKKGKKRRGGGQSIFAGNSKTVIPCKKYKTIVGKIMRTLATKFKWQTTQTLRLTSGIDQQGSNYTGIYTAADILSQISKVSLGSPAATANAYLNYAHQDITLLNQSNSDCILWIYDLMIREEVGGAGLNPLLDWKQGIIDEGGAVDDWLIPYSTPYQSKKFTQRWRVLKVRKFTLSSGAIHQHRIEMYPKHKINAERVNNTASAGTGTGGGIIGVRGMTSTCMFVTLGGLVNDTVSTVNVGTAATGLDILSVVKYDFMGIGADQTLYSKTSSFGTITTAELMNEKTGAVVASALA